MINTNLNLNSLQHSSPQALPSDTHQLTGREVAPLKQQDSNLIAKAYDKAMSDYQELQLRLEGQVQQKEEALFSAAHQNKKLLRDFADATRREEDLTNRVHALTEELAASKHLNSGFGEQVRGLQDQLALLKVDWENAVRERKDFQQRVEASEHRNHSLTEANVVLQRELDAVRRLPSLEKRLKVIDEKIIVLIEDFSHKPFKYSALLPFKFTYGIAFLATPFIGFTLGTYLGASSFFAFNMHRIFKPGPSIAKDEIYADLLKQRDDLFYQILEIRKGRTESA